MGLGCGRSQPRVRGFPGALAAAQPGLPAQGSSQLSPWEEGSGVGPGEVTGGTLAPPPAWLHPWLSLSWAQIPQRPSSEGYVSLGTSRFGQRGQWGEANLRVAMGLFVSEPLSSWTCWDWCVPGGLELLPTLRANFFLVVLLCTCLVGTRCFFLGAVVWDCTYGVSCYLL